MQDYKKCRRKIVAWDINPPDPFPGFGGTIGLGQDCAVLDNGDWLLVFHAGYWHVSMATPYVVPGEVLDNWTEAGFRKEIVAPRGGRIMSVRSRDGGLTWSKPETVLDGRWDEGPVGISKLAGGTILVFVNNQASWYGVDRAPKGHLHICTRTGVIRSEDNGRTWSEPVWFESPGAFYVRAYAQAVQLPDGGVLYPVYCNVPGQRLSGAIFRSDDKGCSWYLLSRIQRTDGRDIDEPSILRLHDRRLMLITRPDAAVFYSGDDGRSWLFSHTAPFAPLKASRLALLDDGTVAAWMTSHGVLRASWSTDLGKTWRVGTDGKPFALDPDHYGYPGGFQMSDESVVAVYYDGANKQQRTGVWAIRFRISPGRDRLEILPVPGADSDMTRKAGAGRPSDIEMDVDAMGPASE